MQKTCQKCGHINPTSTGDVMEACPNCSAIYSRVAQAMAQQAAKAVRPTAASPRGIKEFAEQMRAASLYPTFRGLVHVIYLVMLVMAGLALVMGLLALTKGEGMTRIAGFAGGVFFAIAIFVFARVAKEGSLMLADLSDAAVQLAAKER
ncbi:hypothetical protein J1777_06005 [Comamonas denitrificans]|uniref:Transmembrane protein n=1 Tax=Comamonas denitrificans TaxID=117506 RepID=A0A939KD81_9BURK|nr:hypothetical protein [Comamonas denitrificans]MBO1249391.1 hypothetical protein [Comamonas denitrificans]